MASGDLQERIETVLAEHRLNVLSEWCTAKGCEWNKPWGTAGALESMTEHRSHVAAMIAPLIREAQAEAWDKGHADGWQSRQDDWAAGFVPSGYTQDDTNPYRSNE